MFRHIHGFFHHHYHLRYHGVYRHAKKLFVLDMTLLALIIFLSSATLYLLFWKSDINDKIEFSVSLGNNRIRSGDEVILGVHFVNHTGYTFSPLNVTYHLPSGFVLDPNAPQNLTTSFPSNAYRASTGIQGTLWTEPGKEVPLVAILSYTIKGTDFHGEKIVPFLARLPESVIKTEVHIATTSFAGTNIPYSIEVKNTGTKNTADIALSLDANEHHILTTKLPPLSANSSTIVTGFLTTPSSTGKLVFTATPLFSRGDIVIPQDKIATPIATVLPQAHIAAMTNAPVSFVEPGMTIPLTLNWQNNDTVPLEQGVLKLVVNPHIVDLPATAHRNNIDFENNTLIMRENTHPALHAVAVGQNDSLPLYVVLQPHFHLDTDEASILDLTPALQFQTSKVAGQAYTAFGDTLHFPVVTEVNFNGEARYYSNEGDQIGRGPLPPTVGETTKYWITLSLRNTSNALKNATVTTMLPQGVEFTGRQSVTLGKEFSYSAQSRRVTWQYVTIPAWSQTGLFFEVAVTPTANQVGKPIILTEGITFTARDELVGKNFSLSLPPTTNELPANDQGGVLGANVVE